MDKKNELTNAITDLYTNGKSIIDQIRGTDLDKENKMSTRTIPLSEYQTWYTQAYAIVQQLAPDRLQEFKEVYRSDKRDQIDVFTYTISDYLSGYVVGGKHRTNLISLSDIIKSRELFISKFGHQIEILNSTKTRIDSFISDIKGTIRMEVYDSEIEQARILYNYEFLRSAGAIAGVVLEGHLSNVCKSHNISVTKRNPALSDFYDTLKNSGTLDVPNWRWMQRLGDIRNYCVHKKEREPTKDEVLELINGVEKAIKTVF